MACVGMFPGFNQLSTKQRIKCLAQKHKPESPGSKVKHSTSDLQHFSKSKMDKTGS